MRFQFFKDYNSFFFRRKIVFFGKYKIFFEFYFIGCPRSLITFFWVSITNFIFGWKIIFFIFFATIKTFSLARKSRNRDFWIYEKDNNFFSEGRERVKNRGFLFFIFKIRKFLFGWKIRFFEFSKNILNVFIRWIAMLALPTRSSLDYLR